MLDEEKTLATQLAKGLRRLRSTRGWSQAELADRINVTPEYVGLLERGRRLPSVPMLCSLGAALHAGLDELFGRNPRSSDWFDEAADLLGSMTIDERNMVMSMLRGWANTKKEQPSKPRVILGGLPEGISQAPAGKAKKTRSGTRSTAKRARV